MKSQIVNAIVLSGNASQDNPYTAFRKRNDKMITRRNRKYDEQNYERLYQFKKSFEQLTRLMELVCSREKMKSKLVQILYRQFSQRNFVKDWNGDNFNSVMKQLNLEENEIQTYFQCNLSSLNSLKTSDEKRGKESPIDTHTSNVRQTSSKNITHSNTVRRSSKLSSGDKLLQLSLTNDSPDGRFTFVPNNTSIYIQPTANICPQIGSVRGKKLVRFETFTDTFCIETFEKILDKPS